MSTTHDALHLATARSLGSARDAFVVYDERLAQAATDAGLPVVAPA
jgi:predicted nucleic acid-binding protein